MLNLNMQSFQWLFVNYLTHISKNIQITNEKLEFNKLDIHNITTYTFLQLVKKSMKGQKGQLLLVSVFWKIQKLNSLFLNIHK